MLIDGLDRIFYRSYSLGNILMFPSVAFVLSFISHIVLILILMIPIWNLSKSSFNAQDAVLVEMVDITDYPNLSFKYNPDEAGSEAKQHSNVGDKKDIQEEIKNEKSENIHEEKYDNNINIESNVITKTDPIEKVDKQYDVTNNEDDVDNGLKKLTKTLNAPKVKPIQNNKSQPSVKKPMNKPVQSKDDMAGLLRSIDLVKSQVKNTSSGTESGLIGKGEVQNYSLNKPFSQDMLTAIRSQFMKCWTIPLSSLEIRNMNVVVEVALKRDGSVASAKVASGNVYKNNQYFDALANSAIQAIYKCNPIVGLPKDRYEQWKEMEFNFDPSVAF